MGNQRITTTPFGAQSTAIEVITGIDLGGKRAIVTGGASGNGVETARAQAGPNAEVALAVRNLAAGERTAADITATTGNKHVRVAPLDLANQASVAGFVADRDAPLHPGQQCRRHGSAAEPHPRGPGDAVRDKPSRPFALASGPHDALAASGNARVVSVGSVGHVNSEVVLDDIHFLRRPYDRWAACGQSKTADVRFAVAACTRWAADGITVNALKPGRISGTNLSRHIGDVANAPASLEPGSTAVSWKTVVQGAATSVLLAASPLLDGVGGRDFEDCNEAEPHETGIRRGVAAYALDPDNAVRLRQFCIDILTRRQSDG